MSNGSSVPIIIIIGWRKITNCKSNLGVGDLESCTMLKTNLMVVTML